jgi:hypothetical protein
LEAVEILPAAHWEHVSTPAVEKYPSKQSLQALAPDPEYLPATQSSQEERPSVAARLPTAQERHAPSPPVE